MQWLPFALGAYLSWACCNLLSKILISQHVKSPSVNLITMGVWNLLPLLLIPIHGLVIPSFHLIALGLTTGILYLLILIPYFKALAIEEASRVIPLWRLTPLFILLFSTGFVQESLNSYQLVAFFMLVVGGFLVSIKQMSDFLRPSKAFYLMLFSSVVSSLYCLIAKSIYTQLSFYDGFTLIRTSVAFCLVGLLLIPQNRIEFAATMRQMTPYVRNLMILNGLLDFSALVLCNFAMSIAPASLVSASAGIQAVFVLALSILLSIKFPKLLQEDTSRSVLTQKGIAIALIIVGTGIISFH
ncbi:MAG TPA: EamA family transporter [Allocoleopsis sp.]